ncbi:MAG: hypothetical protein ACI841_004851, partial [Planctomycetota bacterium]
MRGPSPVFFAIAGARELSSSATEQLRPPKRRADSYLSRDSYTTTPGNELGIMAQITAKLVRDLREKTGAGMMDCKKALSASEGDFEVAVDHLRKLGLKAAGKKAGRTTGEGRVLARIGDDGHTGVMVAVSCETDFVARTP